MKQKQNLKIIPRLRKDIYNDETNKGIDLEYIKNTQKSIRKQWKIQQKIGQRIKEKITQQIKKKHKWLLSMWINVQPHTDQVNAN